MKQKKRLRSVDYLKYKIAVVNNPLYAIETKPRMDIEKIKPLRSYKEFASLANVIGLEGQRTAEDDDRADSMPKRKMTSPRVTTIDIAIKMIMIQVCPRKKFSVRT